MKLLLAILLPFLAVALARRYWTAFVLLLMQLTFIGWIPAIIVAWLVILSADADRRADRLERALRGG